MPQEIERKFLILAWPSVPPDRLLRLTQAYLEVGAVERRVRLIRQQDGDDPMAVTLRAVLTEKRPTGEARVREEVETDLDVTKAEAMIALAAHGVVDKTRAHYGAWELDIFHGALEGMSLAEIELPHVDSPLPPLPAGLILGAEVTADPHYKNAALAQGRPPVGASESAANPASPVHPTSPTSAGSVAGSGRGR